MAPAKKSPQTAKTPLPAGRAIRWLAGPGGVWLLAAAIVAGFLLALRLIWNAVGRDVLASGQYQVTVDSLELTSLPEWIHRDLRADLIRDLALDGPLSIMDEALTDRVRSALSLNPWIARVERIEKRHPARVKIDVVYRRPACMVEVAGELIPVDGEAIVLPGDDFTPLEKQTRYPRLAGIDSGPLGPAGTRWGNARVAGGAEIAAVLLPAWERFQLERIIPTAMPGQVREYDQTYELLTRRGTWIFWGRAPGANMPGEPAAADKLARLDRYMAEHGTLEGPAGPQKLDVTRPDSIEVPPPSTASKGKSAAK
jgi:cell division septal protein FtsQ